MSLLFSKLCNRLEEVSEDYHGVLGLAIKDLTNGSTFMINSDELFPVASTIKVPILMEFYNRIEKGEIDPLKMVTFEKTQRAAGSGVIKALTEDKLSMPLIDYATLMITVSDNTATNLFIDLLGMDSINNLIFTLGLKKTKLARKMMDMEAFRAGKDSATTPRELMHLFESLYRKEGMSNYVADETLKMLKKPKEGIIQGVIRNSVPDSIEVANKAGWVSGATLDAGIVYLPNRPYALAILAKHILSSDLHMWETLKILSQATKMIHNYFDEISLSTHLGRKR